MIGALLVAAVAVYRLDPGLSAGAGADRNLSPSTSPTVAVSPTPAVTPGVHPPGSSPSPRGPTVAATPAASTVVPSLPEGPGTTEPGILYSASPSTDGSFEVSEVLLLAEATSSLDLRPPPLEGAGARFDGVTPVVSQLQITAGDQPVLVPGAMVNGPVRLDLPAPTTRFELRYQLSGVTIRSVPSRAGRALAALASVVKAPDSTLPIAFHVSGHAVLNLACPQLPLKDRACAAGKAPKLRVGRALPLSNAVVVVQFDLPRPQ